MNPESQNQALAHLKKASGMLAKVISMVESGCYCMDVIQQSKAVQGLLGSANKAILENHLNTCFKDGMGSKSPKKQKELINEILKITL